MEETNPGRGRKAQDLLEAANNRLPCGTTPEIFNVRLQHGLDIAVEGHQQHFVLAAERAVKAALAEPGLFKQAIEGRCLVTLAPKQMQSAVEDFLVIEFSRPRHG